MPMKSEELARYICGINKDYEILTIAVFMKGNSMRLLGPNGSHLVHSSNNNDIDGCMREAALVWKLTDVFAVARDKLNSEHVVEKIEQLRQRAAQLRKAAEQQAAKIREKQQVEAATSSRARKPV
jgi:hypothetical protein